MRPEPDACFCQEFRGCGQRNTDVVKRHLKCCCCSCRSHYRNPHKIKLCLPIPQLSAAKSSGLGFSQIKTERPKTPCSQVRPRALYPGAQKHPVRCVNTILPAHFTCGIQIYSFNLVGLRTYLLKYNGCQLAIAEKRGFSPLHNNTSNISPQIPITTPQNNYYPDFLKIDDCKSKRTVFFTPAC